MAKLQRAEFKVVFLYLVSQFTLKLLEYSTETILDRILKSSRTIFKENLTIPEKQDRRILYTKELQF